MENKNEKLGKILKNGLLPNLINDKLNSLKIAETAFEAGIRAMEVSCRRPDTLSLFKNLKKEFPEIAFGVSSLIEDGPYYEFLQRRGPRFPSIQQAVDAGADFLVSVLSFSSKTYKLYNHLPIIAGVETANEAKIQLDYGASLVKFCNPERKGGPAYFKAINGGPIHFGLPLLLTGNMRPELIDKYVSVGMLVTVAGFDIILADKYQIYQLEPDYRAIKSAMEKYIAVFKAARATHMPGVDFASADPIRIQRQSGKFMNVVEKS